MATPLRQPQQEGCVYIMVGRTRMCSYQWQAAGLHAVEARYLEALNHAAKLEQENEALTARNQELVADLRRARRALGHERPVFGLVVVDEEREA